MTLTGQWTPEERLYLISWIAAAMRWNRMRKIEPQAGFPNAETIMVIATSAPEFLNGQNLVRDAGFMIDQFKSVGVVVKDGNQCQQEFYELMAANKF